MAISIEQVIYRIPAWSGRSPVVAPLVGGLTNRIYRVDVDGMSYVVRIPGDGTEWLAIDRANEFHNTRSAAAAGVSPRVVDQLSDVNVLVLEYIHGETLTVPAMQRPRMPTQIARVLKQLHAGPRFLLEFNIFRLTRHYLRIAEEHCIRIPDDYLRYMSQVERIEAAFAQRPVPTVPCHNDLLAANILNDGQRLWLIDFEYSGNNDATFELGNTCQEQQYRRPASRGNVRCLFWRRLAREALADEAQHDHVGRWLGSLGCDPGYGFHDRVRLLGLGRGALGPGPNRAEFFGFHQVASGARNFGVIARRRQMIARFYRGPDQKPPWACRSTAYRVSGAD